MGFSYTFNWPADPPAEEVYVTGSFDNWSKSAPLAQNVDGSWSVSIPLPSEKIVYKFVVDNNWVIDPNAKTETDLSGITNNVIDLDDIAAATSVSNLPGGFIPESGGIPIVAASSSSAPEEEHAHEPALTESKAQATTASDSTATGPETELSTDAEAVQSDTVLGDKADEPSPPIAAARSEPEPVKDEVEQKEDLAPAPTVMPQSDILHSPFLGTPGIVIPANANEIREFREVSTIDPQTLNAVQSVPKFTTENPPEPEHTPADTVADEEAPSQGGIGGVSAAEGDVLLGPNEELPRSPIKPQEEEEEPVAHEASEGRSDAVNVSESQQPTLSAAEEAPVIIKDTQIGQPPSADSTVSEVVDTSTSTAPEIVNAEDIPKEAAEPSPSAPPASKSQKSKLSFFDKWLGPNTVRVQHYPVIVLAVCVTLYGVRYYFTHGGSMLRGGNADDAFAVFREL
ncbi:hypothetical protein V1525DRAFT_400529 [Lipomyces kononenkoae]|uniref:Uncharacterized protein n=1 Tax=Lipomyces kononenkoae TaxID=34357 RepID=A0ACC3T4G4_LIPKO